MIGIAFIGCAAVVYKYPIPAAVTSLVLYLGNTAVRGVLIPLTLVEGWIWKTIFIVCLFKAVQAAIASESERKASAISPLLSNPPATPI